jgi:hypothetical protein
MWPQLEHYLPEFPSAVLTAVDATGTPYSLRCHPALVPAEQVLHIALPAGVALQPGPACLLCHAHNERLWNLKSFAVRGVLERPAAGPWIFEPRHFIPGMGIGGWRSYVHFVRHGRAATREYFAKRGQPVPHVDWESVLALFPTEPEQPA